MDQTASTPPPRVLVEVAASSVRGACDAVAGGAHRIELCQGLETGGLTPSPGLVEAVRAAVTRPVFALLRPRGGDFLYSGDELAVMERDLDHLRRAGVDGIVTGALDADGRIDQPAVRLLVAAAAPLPVTFHRAFDLCADPLAAIDELIGLGVARVLTSGQAGTAAAGAAAIRAAVERARGALAVIAGGGIAPDHAAALVAATGVRELHLSASARRESLMRFRRAGVALGQPARDEYERRVTDGAIVAKVVAALGG